MYIYFFPSFSKTCMHSRVSASVVSRSLVSWTLYYGFVKRGNAAAASTQSTHQTNRAAATMDTGSRMHVQAAGERHAGIHIRAAYGCSGGFWYDPLSLEKSSLSGSYDSRGERVPRAGGPEPYSEAP